MARRLIKRVDGTLVEVEAHPDDVRQIAASDAAKKVDKSIDLIKPILIRACRPIIAAWNELSTTAHYPAPARGSESRGDQERRARHRASNADRTAHQPGTRRPSTQDDSSAWGDADWSGSAARYAVEPARANPVL